MAFLNYAKKEISAKIVYYGPGLSGKTTNLEWIYKKVLPERRGKLISLETRTDRTLFFDFLPVQLGEVGGFVTRFNVYTVPGQIFYNETRKMVLKGVDGIVFVADSQKEMAHENLESLRNLEQNLKAHGRHIKDIPMVFQYNKRDLPKILSVDELNRLLNPNGLPFFEAVALRGDGVFATLTRITRMVAEKIQGLDRTTGPSVLERNLVPEVPIIPVHEKEPEVKPRVAQVSFKDRSASQTAVAQAPAEVQEVFAGEPSIALGDLKRSLGEPDAEDAQPPMIGPLSEPTADQHRGSPEDMISAAGIDTDPAFLSLPISGNQTEITLSTPGPSVSGVPLSVPSFPEQEDVGVDRTLSGGPTSEISAATTQETEALPAVSLGIPEVVSQHHVRIPVSIAIKGSNVHACFVLSIDLTPVTDEKLS